MRNRNAPENSEAFCMRKGTQKETFRFTQLNASFCFLATFRFADYTQGLRLQAFPYRDSSSTQMLVLTQNSSGVCIRDMGLSKRRLQ